MFLFGSSRKYLYPYTVRISEVCKGEGLVEIDWSPGACCTWDGEVLLNWNSEGMRIWCS